MDRSENKKEMLEVRFEKRVNLNITWTSKTTVCIRTPKIVPFQSKGAKFIYNSGT